MQQQFYLDKALEQSQERAAFKIAPLRDVWEVRIENGETPYTLIHHLSSHGQAGDSLAHVPVRYRTLDDLLADQDAQEDAVLGSGDWHPVNEDTKKWLMTESPTAHYSTPGFWPPLS